MLRAMADPPIDLVKQVPLFSDLNDRELKQVAASMKERTFHTGDHITIVSDPGKIDVDVPEADMAKRRAAWKKPSFKSTRGTLYKYIKTVKNASEGCVTDE